MKAQLKVISSELKKLEPKEIVDLIKQDKWSTVQEMKTDDFVNQVSPGEYAPNMYAIIQSRPVTYNPPFVEQKVRESRNGENYSQSATMVYFPEKAVIDGKEIDANSYRLIGGTHGMVIDRYLGKNKKSTNIVNYKHDLGSDEGKLYRLANLLNVIKNESQPLPLDAIKMEVYRLMDKRISEGKEGKPSDEERKSFLKDYPQIDDRVWTNWIANHEFGGRRDPDIKYSLAELQVFHAQLKNMSCYDGYYISSPCTVASWDSAIMGRALISCMEKNTRKLLIPLYAGNATQAEGLRLGKLQSDIERAFEDLKKFYGMEEMDMVLMKYQK